jgi:hypothetical protein
MRQKDRAAGSGVSATVGNTAATRATQHLQSVNGLVLVWEILDHDHRHQIEQQLESQKWELSSTQKMWQKQRWCNISTHPPIITPTRPTMRRQENSKRPPIAVHRLGSRITRSQITPDHLSSYGITTITPAPLAALTARERGRRSRPVAEPRRAYASWRFGFPLGFG